MLKIALVIFREMLEISLILGVILATTISIKQSRIYIILGVMIGFVGAAILAFFIDGIAGFFGGYGEELVDVVVIMITVVFVASAAIWVKHSGAKFNKRVIKLSEASDDSFYAKMILIMVVATTIFREATEIILFLHAIASAYSPSSTDYVIGFTIGAFGGIIVAIAIKYGLNKIAVRYLFSISFILLALISASLASEAAGILTSVGLVDFMSVPIWDSEQFISDFSLMGKVLKLFVGYDSKPNMLQVIFYFATLFIIYMASKIKEENRKKDVKIIG